MKSYERGMSKHSPLLPKVRSILKALNIKYRFKWTIKNNHAMGVAMPDQNTIVVYGYTPNKFIETTAGYYRTTRRRITIQEFLSTVFHEINHILAARRGLHQGAHLGLPIDNLTPKRFATWAANLYRAERYCDAMGAKLMKKHFRRIPFEGGYVEPDGKKMVNYMILEVARVYNIKGVK